MSNAPRPPDGEITEILRRSGLVEEDETPPCVPLAGGVSSDISRFDTRHGRLCVKRALPRLKVNADWRVPVERNMYEVRWFETVAYIAPEAVPQILAHDPEAGLFVMDYLDPALFPVWKEQLHGGAIDIVTAAIVGARLARIHAGTANDPAMAQRFDTDALFRALRLEPYLEATARAHPDLEVTLLNLARRTAETKLALVHGDVSPKNILIGPDGPLFLDAECAWYGDPAFDLAFCLNHLLLKCLWTPRASDRFLLAFRAIGDNYLKGVTWESAASLEARAASLLPGLLLARVDGKSPVEYITAAADKDHVRRTARALLTTPPQTLAAVSAAWKKELAK